MQQSNHAPAPSNRRLERLIKFVQRDRGNVLLLIDAVTAALDDGQFDLAATMLDNRSASVPMTPTLLNLQGLTALSQSRFDDAVTAFTQLHDGGSSDPAVRFNLAWSKSMVGDFEAVHDLLDDEAIAAAPRAPALKIHAMHHLELYEDALAIGHGLAELYPDNQPLMGALASLAMDAGEIDLARLYAGRAHDDPDGLATLGMLALDGQDAAASLALFELALARQPQNPRAWVGKGLSLLTAGDSEGGAAALAQGARYFEDHLGSWIAAGWAHFVGGDRDSARAAFERIITIDPNFAESHGGLAVLDIVEGDFASAETRCTIALRLDRNCFGGALAKSLLLEQQGKGAAAQKVRDAALSSPVSPDGRTISQALVGFARMRQ